MAITQDIIVAIERDRTYHNAIIHNYPRTGVIQHAQPHGRSKDVVSPRMQMRSGTRSSGGSRRK